MAATLLEYICSGDLNSGVQVFAFMVETQYPPSHSPSQIILLPKKKKENKLLVIVNYMIAFKVLFAFLFKLG